MAWPIATAERMAEVSVEDRGEGVSEPTWPNAVTLVIAAETPRQYEWAASTAIGLVRELAEQRHKVILSDLQAGRGSLRAVLDIPEGPGIVDVLFRGASFSAVAKRPAGESFYFLSIGTAPPPRQVLFQHPRWTKIAGRLSESNAYLLPCVSAADWLNAGPIAGFEPCIVLNAVGLEVELPSGARRLAEFLAPPEIREEGEPARPVAPAATERLAEPEEAPPIDQPVDVEATPIPPSSLVGERRRAADAAGPEVLMAPEPRRDSAARSWRRAIGPITAGVAVVVLAVAVWNAQRDGLLVREHRAETEVLPDIPTGAALEAAAERGAEPEAAVAAEPLGVGGPAEETVLTYSVVIASYSSFDDAIERQRSWSRPELPFYVAPTVVRGVVYYRVFAGMVPQKEEAEEVMRQLVREGIKDTIRDWDVKAARLAFDFGTYHNADDAHAAVESLLGRDIHAYMVSAPGGAAGGRAYHVYAGGYERAEDARPLREQLARAGLESELVERVGLVSR